LTTRTFQETPQNERRLYRAGVERVKKERIALLRRDRTTRICGKKKEARQIRRAPEESPGNVLLSHAVAHAVPSALKGLTTVFGMGTGVAPSLWSPGN